MADHKNDLKKPIWEQWDNENDRQFFAFTCYRDQFPGTRTKVEAWNEYKRHIPRRVKGAKAERPHSEWHKWKNKFDWETRVQAWDEEQHRLSMEKIDLRRDQLVLQSWSLLEEIYRLQHSDLKSATFDERTRLANSIRDTIKSFTQAHPPTKGGDGVTVWELSCLREPIDTEPED